MANIAQTVNVLQAMILTDGAQMLLTPTYHVFEMYKAHQDATLLPIHLQSAEYREGEAGIPALNASASKDKDASGAIHLTLCHTDPTQPATLDVELRGAGLSSVSGRVLSADALNARNTFEQPNALAPRDLGSNAVRLTDGKARVTLPPASVAVLKIAG